MNATILHRLVWKELRTLRALWLSLLAMAFVLELGFAWIVERPHERSEWVFAVALYLPVVYSLACAAMAFAGEREEGTDQLLSRLAAPPMALLSVKLAMNVLSTAVLLVILYPVAWMLAPWVADWNVWGIFDQADFNRIRLLAFAWGVSLFSWGVFFSLVFRRVLTCLISATVAATLTPLVASAILNLLPFNDAKIEAFEWSMRLALMPGLLLLASSWLVQTWDENRWPRSIELLLDGWHRRASKRGRPSDLATPNVQERGGWRMLVRPFGLCLSDELLSEWRRETRRLLWLEWKSVRWVFVGLVLAAALALFGTAHSQADMRLVMTTLPMTLAFVAFVMGVWSFQGQQREQRFRFFAGQGASPHAMWLVKHVVWLSFAVAAVLILLGFAALASDRVGNSEELNASGFNRLVSATFGDRLPWDYQDRPVWPLRFVFLAAHATRTTSMEFFEADEVVGLWPLISLLLLSLGRGVLGAWLFFAIGQFVALVIPRAVTAMLVGLLPFAAGIAWWFVMSFSQVPLLIAVVPVLLGLLAAAWGRMSDWLEERFGWRRWGRVAAMLLIPMFVAFIGMAAYRVYEIPLVELPFGKTAPSVEARRTGDEWLQLAEQLEPLYGPLSGGGRLASWDDLIGIRSATDANGRIIWNPTRNREWIAANAATLEKAMQLAQRPDCAFPNYNYWEPLNDHEREQIGRLALLMKMTAFESLANHRLDEALQRAMLLYQFGQQLGGRHGGMLRWHQAVRVQEVALNVLREWALSSDQTEESLLAALGRSDQEPSHPVAQLVRAEGNFAVHPLNLLQGDYSKALERHDDRYREVIPSPFRWMFWERARDERLLNVLAQEGINNLRHGLDRHLVFPERQLKEPYGRLLRDRNEVLDYYGSGTRLSNGGQWQRTSADSPNGWGWDEWTLSRNYFPVLGGLETQRRGLWLTIALQAYRAKHGQLPVRLDELIGRYLDRIPSDPFSGLAFDYRPNGFPFVVYVTNRKIEENTPLLLAPGENSSRREPVTTDYGDQVLVRNPDEARNGLAPADLMWVSINANPIRYGSSISRPYDRDWATFSLKSSF